MIGAADAIAVAPEAPTGPDALRLIGASEAELSAAYPPEERFAFSVEKLVEAGVWFVVARDGDGRALGCGGLAEYPGYGELKRIYVDRQARGRGVGRAVLAALEARARALGLPLVRLETGDAQIDAMALYRRCGYMPTGRFGEYPEAATSRYFEKAL